MVVPRYGSACAPPNMVCGKKRPHKPKIYVLKLNLIFNSPSLLTYSTSVGLCTRMQFHMNIVAAGRWEHLSTYFACLWFAPGTAGAARPIIWRNIFWDLYRMAHLLHCTVYCRSDIRSPNGHRFRFRMIRHIRQWSVGLDGGGYRWSVDLKYRFNFTNWVLIYRLLRVVSQHPRCHQIGSSVWGGPWAPHLCVGRWTGVKAYRLWFNLLLKHRYCG